MLSPRWRKVMRDLWTNKTRTMLVVFSIAIGVFAVGMVLHTNLLVAERVRDDFNQSLAANITLYAENINDDMVQSIANMPGVDAAEGRSSVTVRIQVGDDNWALLDLTAFPDPDNIRINRVLPISEFREVPAAGAERGRWPPHKNQVVIERSAYFRPGLLPEDLAVGDTIMVKTEDDKVRSLEVVGLAHESKDRFCVRLMLRCSIGLLISKSP